VFTVVDQSFGVMLCSTDVTCQLNPLRRSAGIRSLSTICPNPNPPIPSNVKLNSKGIGVPLQCASSPDVDDLANSSINAERSAEVVVSFTSSATSATRSVNVGAVGGAGTAFSQAEQSGDFKAGGDAKFRSRLYDPKRLIYGCEENSFSTRIFNKTL